jgi:outer membrane protein assembly factor BamB
MRNFLTAMLFLAAATPLRAADWPQWLGPRRDGSSEEIIAPWKKAPEIIWQQPVGEGHSAPVVANRKVYVFSKIADKDEEQVEAFDSFTSKPLWKQTCKRGPFKGLFGNGPRGTPTVHEGKIYTFGITGVLTCLDANDGKRLWEVDTLKQYNAANLFFGASCSPLIDGTNVVVNVGGKGASIVAFDKDTGKEVWKSLDDKASYASPITIGKGEKRRLVFLTAKGLVALRPDNGQPAWQYPFADTLAESSTTPVFIPGAPVLVDGQVVVSDILIGSSITLGTVALKIKDDTATKLWLNPDLTSYFSTPVALRRPYDLYMVTGTKPPALKTQAMLHNVSLDTGKWNWRRTDKVGSYHASLLRTGDDRLLLLEETGDLVLIDPSIDFYVPVARAKICGNTWAHPALANGRLYVRDNKELICVELR